MFIRNDAPETPVNSRWRLIEKLCLELFMAVALFTVLLDAVHFSDSLATEHKVSGLETSIWSSSRQIDLNDGQLRGFRGFLPSLVVAAVLFIYLKSKWISYSGTKGYKPKLEFYIASGLACCLYLHGPGLVFLLLWAAANYYLGREFSGSRYFPVAMWTANLSFLIFAEYTEGLKFAWVGLGLLVIPRKGLLQARDVVASVL